jgi:SOS-response transcriptional repressor LexA
MTTTAQASRESRPMTARQSQCLAFIESFISDRGISPTLREIAAGMNISSINGVNDHLKALERRGLITRDPMISRSIRVVESPNVLVTRYGQPVLDLLAVIHGDGGHRVDEVGVDQAAIEALARVQDRVVHS